MVPDTTGTSKVMITVFFPAHDLRYVDILDPNERFTQDHFIGFGLSNLKKHAQNVCRRKQPVELARQMGL
jgi:hypothetical protein